MADEMETDDALLVNGRALVELKVVDLKEELEKRGLSKVGNKKQLLSRLKAQLTLEKFRNMPVEDDDSVPNIPTDEETSENEMVREYMAERNRLIQEQKQARRRMEQEMEQESSQDEAVSTKEDEKASSEQATSKPVVEKEKNPETHEEPEEAKPMETKPEEGTGSKSAEKAEENNMDTKEAKTDGSRRPDHRGEYDSDTEEDVPKTKKSRRRSDSSSSSSSSSTYSSRSRSRSKSKERERAQKKRPTRTKKPTSRRSESSSSSSRSRSRSRSRSHSRSSSRGHKSRSRSRSPAKLVSKSRSRSRSPTKPESKLPVKSGKEQEPSSEATIPSKKRSRSRSRSPKSRSRSRSRSSSSDSGDEVVQKKLRGTIHRTPARAEKEKVEEHHEESYHTASEDVSRDESRVEEDMEIDKEKPENGKTDLEKPVVKQEPEAEDNKENQAVERQISSTSDAGDGIKEKPVRKRRWGSTHTRQKNTFNISTDSLKGLIPDIKPSTLLEPVLDLGNGDEKGISDTEEDFDKKDFKIQRTVIQDIKEETPTEVAAPEGDIRQVDMETEDSSEKKGASQVVRRISRQAPLGIAPDEPQAARRSPSPARNPVSVFIHVKNLTRPFTLPQLKEVLGRTGTLVEDGFWIDKIKSHCLVKYENEEQAKESRQALHGTRWPSSNPKVLRVDYATEDEFKHYKEGDIGPSQIKRQIQQEVPRADIREKEKEQGVREVRVKEDAKRRDAVREWDRDKLRRSRSREPPSGRERGDRDRERGDRDRDRDRERDRDKKRPGRSPERRSGEHRGDRVKERKERRASEKKVEEEEPPAKLLDDLFCKTKATPCIYWLPLTEEQIVLRQREKARREMEREKRIKEREQQVEEDRRKRDHERMERRRQNQPTERSRDRSRERGGRSRSGERRRR